MTNARAPRAIAVRIVRLAHALGLPLPAAQTAGAAGLDLQAAIDAHAPIVLAPGARALVPTGFIFELPPGHEGQVRPRSGLALNHGVTVLNSPGTIDADYRGEVKVLIVNLGGAPFEIRKGDRIAQIVVLPVTRVRLREVARAEETARGAGGFGSTGKAVEPKTGAKRPKTALTARKAGSALAFRKPARPPPKRRS